MLGALAFSTTVLVIRYASTLSHPNWTSNFTEPLLSALAPSTDSSNSPEDGPGASSAQRCISTCLRTLGSLPPGSFHLYPDEGWYRTNVSAKSFAADHVCHVVRSIAVEENKRSADVGVFGALVSAIECLVNADLICLFR
jgi:hypothetical protein